ncbi:pleckstrin homology domain-containing family G member 5 isoform X3 [Drosophila busckii]|uniref:pleckstrin homology domain-containing family G member 5 isoform X3 n=1 Tax=Drosophila busckii TaxID=30019 RepID=UPI00083F1E19|nr:pleckstrin homology domain-containing family G member 5 isoform X3 [Drosophila busckii]
MGAGGLAVFEVILTSSPAEPQLAVIVQQQQQSNKHQQPTILEAWSVRAAREMHEKLLEKEDTRKEKTEKTGKEKPAAGGKDKIHKQSKFAERLRRSFRRSEHRSLELKRPEPTPDVLQARNRGTPPLPKSTDNNNIVAWPPFSLPTQFQLPGLSLGGHINTALLLDSPDECTPPEYAYQHLSSVATTNTNTTSSSSLESNFELSELPTVFYWNSTTHIAMGGELSTAGHSSDPTQTPQPKRRPEASTQAQPQLQQQQPAVLPPSASRSCSLTSESSSVRLTRLHNFLFKSSNESTRSFQGHSNDGFTASSHNSSSGEWEQLGAYNPSSNNGPHDFTGGSFLEEDATDENETDEVATLPVESHDAGAGAYYQYTLTSPNNPFLPEITARTYHSNYEDNELQLEEHSRPENKQQTYVPHQLPTPAYSRAGSQESTHSESAMSCPNAPTPSPASSSSSTPGRHRRKLFSLNSPTRLLHSGGQQTQPIAIHQQPPHHPLDALASPSDSPNVAMLARSLNPFRKTASSPTSVPADLRSKREEFLRATMKICLVVSPPSSKLQLKSKSLTHLDGLDTSVSCQHETGAAAVSTGKTSTAAQLGQLGQGVHITSSQECFSVSFRLEASQHHDEEFIPVTKGTTLINALHPALRKRNLSFSQILITDNNPSSSYLDAGPASLSRLDEQTDVESLAGHHLIITERDGSRKTLQKAASFGSRQRPPRLLSSASTEETSEASGHKHIKQRWSSIFGVKNPQQSQLYELLSNYTKNGVPQRSAGFNFEHPSLSDSLAYLHNVSKSWRDFIECKSMSENEIKIQTAIWELVTTEIYYIHALQTVTDLFLACLEAVQEEGLLTEVDQHKLFSNVRSVCEANIKFWTLWLYPMVANSIVTHEPLRCGFFLDGFIAFASIFAPYKVYCAEQSTCQFYCKELNQNNALFTAYLAWCESQKMCNRLRLADIVVRPMQRLTKYSLLLAAIKKHMSDVEEIEAIDVMIHSVENFVFSVNNHLTMRQESERLKGVMARIESYDVLDSNNEVLDKLIKQHSQMFDLCAPMPGCPAYHVRHLFMEGDHKFKDTFGKSDVHCFLLTDILLVCKAMAKKGQGALKVIRQPFLTDHLIVHLSNNNTLNCVYLNEFQVATTAFTLQCSEAKNWYDALWRAKTIYQRLKRGISGNAGDSFRFGATSATGDSLGVRKSPINSSICSHVSSANNSHSGSVEWNDSRNISVEFEKTNSLSSDEGATSLMGNHAKSKQQLFSGLAKSKVNAAGSTSTSNTLTVQPVNHLGQSLPNLSSQNPQTVPLRRGMAFSTSTKNPPLLKTRHITSQNSINWHQIPATPTPPSPRSQHHSPGNAAAYSLQSSMPALLSSDSHARAALPLLQEQITFEKHLQAAKQPLLDPQQASGNETDV